MNRARHNLVLAAVDVELQPEAGSRNFDEFFRLNLVQTKEFWSFVNFVDFFLHTFHSILRSSRAGARLTVFHFMRNSSAIVTCRWLKIL
mmetsp:Transcript_54013/g.112854  ORF Transcript_54013/g.112854 Transcript_54013/m.112854 type:complete len:89 (-) Transcript_54013:990-1256(-)